MILLAIAVAIPLLLVETIIWLIILCISGSVLYIISSILGLIIKPIKWFNKKVLKKEPNNKLKMKVDNLTKRMNKKIKKKKVDGAKE